MRRWAVVLAAVLLLASSCVDGAGPEEGLSPSPSPAAPAEPEPVTGLQIGIVLPPASSGFPVLEAEAIVRAADVLPEDPDLDVRDVRTVEVPTADFRRDAIALLAERGAGLVCTVGDEGAEDLVAVADAFPRTRFCLLAGEFVEPPRNAFAVSWERGPAATVVGAAAALTAPAVPGAPPARVRIVTQGLQVPGEFQDAVLAGARRLRRAIDVSSLSVPVDATVEEVHAAVVNSVGEGGSGAVLIAAGGSPVAAGVLSAAAEVRGLVLGWSVPPTVALDEGAEEGAEMLVASVVRRFDVALRLAVRHVAGEAPAPEPLGLADGYALLPGTHSRWRTIRPRLERYVADLTGQDAVVLELPSPSPTPSPPE